MEGLASFLFARLTRLGVAINCVIAVGVLAFVYFYPENEALRLGGFLAILQQNKTDGVLYVIIVLVAAAFNVSRKPFLTPEVKHTTCHFCGAQMETNELICMRCRRKAGGTVAKTDINHLWSRSMMSNSDFTTPPIDMSLNVSADDAYTPMGRGIPARSLYR